MENELLDNTTQDMEYVGDIPEGWKWVKLGDEIEIISGGTPKTNKLEYWNGNIPWLTIADFNNVNKYVDKAQKTITEIGLSESSTKLLKPGDIIISARGTIGAIAVVKKEMAFNQSCYGIRSKSNEIYQDFLYYLLKNSINMLLKNSYGAVFDTITRETFSLLFCPLPPLPEQKAIAHVLSSIDDKIELLHRQNKTLEEMAMTLFRQWFIEPTKDGLPEGWEEVSLGEFFPVITGKKDANFATDNGLYPFFTCSQKPLKAPSYSFDGNAILLAGNGDFNIKRYRGKFEAYQRTYVLIPYNPEYFNFLYLLMKFYLDDITGSYKGSVINYITKDMIEDFKFSLPKDRTSIIDKLLYFDSIYEKVDANNSQIQTLEKLRDTLLPKLMSGEIRVKI